MKAQTYKLPDGSKTQDVQEFVAEIQKWFAHIQAKIPGWRVTAYDPGFTVTDGKQTVLLPVSLVIAAFGKPEDGNGSAAQ